MLSSTQRSLSSQRCHGFSLIELMLAMIIGLIIIGGVMTLYTTTRNTQRNSQDQLQLISDARFAINTIAHDLRHAGFWGEADLNRSIHCRLGDAECSSPLVGATGDCSAGWYIDIEQPMIATNNSTNFGSTCTSKGYKAGTDVIGVHYANSSAVPVASLAANITYLRSNFQGGGLFVGSTIPTSGSYAELPLWENTPKNNIRSINHRMVSNLYYVSSYTKTAGDGIPSLHRVELQAGPVMKDDVLLPGVDDMQLQFGVDTDTPMDDSANSYVDADKLPLNSSGKVDWGRVRTVKIWILMRAERLDRDGITGTQTFTLANNAAKSYSDGYRRYLVSSVVKLRNTLEIDI